MPYRRNYRQCLLLVALLAITFGYSQSKKRTKKEVFTVNKDVTLEINTSHADVEFDTWNKNKIEIEAIIEVEDATEEEIEKYFKKWNFKAIGNSEKVTVTSKGSHSLLGNGGQFVFADPGMIEQIQTPILANIPNFQIEAIPDLPLMVIESMDDIKFDYDEYKKDGEAYMKKWQKQWKNNFDEEKFKEGMEKWQKSFEKQQDKLIELQGQILEKAEKREKKEKTEKKEKKEKQEKIMFLNGTAKEYQEKLAQIEELVKISGDVKKYKLKELLKEKNELLELLEATENGQFLKLNGNLNFNINTNDDNVFFISSGNKRLKVKKTIKIKMPKKAKLKLNVRHGEVTIASTSENMNAKLSYAALYANVIDGANTTIESSYAPIHVTKWNKGSLKVNFVDNVDLQLVKDINLMANSSKINVGTLGEKGIISGTIGKLLIHNISDSFQTLDIILENTDARIQLPATAFKLYYIGSNSRISYPETVVGTENKTQFNTIIRGYQNNNNSNREININAKYSEVVLNKKS
ncbi:hypothetical protein [uncultured Kordia sp.]|uniref:hypothetical protein n=1 Tax=uncultured Kordia sp. TaxID=507699 RepID=UPI002609390B|nr:hypothetical protein [uncultured Kordia sp.]